MSRCRSILGGLVFLAAQEALAFQSPLYMASRGRGLSAAKKAETKEEEPYLGPQVEVPDIFNFDLTGGRPGTVIETEEQIARKEQIFQEIESGKRDLPDFFDDYGILEEEEFAEYDTDDPEAIDASKLGQYGINDLKSRFDYEWNPETDADPNIIKDRTGFIQENEKDEEGIEVGYDPLFGPSNPMDTRTKLSAVDSYMVDERTKDASRLPQQFRKGDPEIGINNDVVQFIKSLGYY